MKEMKKKKKNYNRGKKAPKKIIRSGFCGAKREREKKKLK